MANITLEEFTYHGLRFKDVVVDFDAEDGDCDPRSDGINRVYICDEWQFDFDDDVDLALSDACREQQKSQRDAEHDRQRKDGNYGS